jgi:nucleotide-binding universal stress UspA family protein
LSKKSNLNHDPYSPSKILVPIDGSPNAKRALDVGIGLANTYGAELVVLNVIPTPTWLVTTSAYGVPASGLDLYYQQQESAADHFIHEALAAAKGQGISKVTSEVTRADKSIVEEIVDAAVHDKIDLVVIGTRGLGGFKKLLQGSVSSGVVAHAHCNVLVVR